MAPLPTTIETPTGVKSVADINAARAADVAAGKNPYAGAGATNVSTAAGLQNPTPVITSNAATNDMESVVKPNAAAIETAIAAQNAKIAADKAVQDAKDQVKAEQDRQNQIALNKAKVDDKNAETKAAALAGATGTGQTPTPKANPEIKSDQPYTNTSGENVNGWRVITKQDGTQQVVTKTANTDGTSSYTPVPTNELNIVKNQEALDKTNASFQVEADKVTNAINMVINGAVPLTQAEQAQVQGLQQSYQQLIQQQQLSNTNAQGVANIRGYQTGAAEYDPTFQAKTIGTIITGGLNKIADLNVKMAGAVANLTDNIKKGKIADIKAAWDVYKEASTKRSTTLQNSIENSQKAIEDARDYNFDVAKFNETKDQNAFERAFKVEQEKETIRHNKATENAKVGVGTGTGVSIPTVSMTALGKPNPVAQKNYLDQVTAQYGPMTAQAIKGLADYSRLPSDFSVRPAKGLSRADMISMVQQYDPTYDENNAAARQAYIKSLAGTGTGTIGSAINSANKSINHLTAFLDTVDTLDNKMSSTINAAFNATTLDSKRRQALSSAKTEGLGVADELAKFFKGTGSTDMSSVDAWKDRLSVNASPADQKGLAQGAINLLAGQLETLSEQYRTTMGRPPNDVLLGPTALANLSRLKNEGYEVNIPGILYTDKDAYLKGGGSVEALKAAHQALVQANDPSNPPTPENVLEYAQLTQ